MEIPKNVHFDPKTHTFQPSKEKAAEPPGIKPMKMPNTRLYDPNAEIDFKATEQNPDPKVSSAIKLPFTGASIIPPNG
ncbi:MAG: hypothetical protein JJU12_02455 [Chlamydiales bacterium]|nr:hypothetical protein [Chlamydiales bacterium]